MGVEVAALAASGVRGAMTDDSNSLTTATGHLDFLEQTAFLLAHLVADRSVRAAVERAGLVLQECLSLGGTVLFCGNGGSAAEASHLAAELTGRLFGDRRPLAGISLSADPAVITAIANDYGFEEVFARQVDALARPGDVLVVLSTSGASANVIRACERAEAGQVRVVAFVGPATGPLDELADVVVRSTGSSSAAVQVGHLALAHAVVAIAEKASAQLPALQEL